MTSKVELRSARDGFSGSGSCGSVSSGSLPSTPPSPPARSTNKEESFNNSSLDQRHNRIILDLHAGSPFNLSECMACLFCSEGACIHKTHISC